MTLKLYELAGEDGTSNCPFVWRTKYALAQKEIVYAVETCGLVDIPQILGGKHRSIPVLVHDELEIGDSWLIAEHLDQIVPDSPSLFGSLGGKGVVRFFGNWLNGTILPALSSLYVLDLANRVRQEDRIYFRTSRESRMGQPLEQAVADREDRLPAVRARFEPLRQTLTASAFIGGDTPNYADYMAIGVLIWATSVATMPLFAKDEALLPWINRCLDLYNGLGRQIKLPGLT